MPPCLVWSAAAKKLKTFDEEATDQHEIDQGYMALTVLMARIHVGAYYSSDWDVVMYLGSNEKMDY